MKFNEVYPGKELFDMPDDYISLDIETTGFDPISDTIIEVGAIKVKNGEIIDKYSVLINPLREIPYNITSLTGINNEDVMHEKTFDEIAFDLIEFIDNNIILGQNIRFDLSFLFVCFSKVGVELNNNFVDLLRISRKMSPELESHRLGLVAEHLGVPYIGAHRAINDAIITHECYMKYKNSVK